MRRTTMNSLELLYKTARLSDTAKNQLVQRGYLVSEQGIHTPKGEVIPHATTPDSLDGYQALLDDIDRVGSDFAPAIHREIRAALVKEEPIL